MFDIEYVARFMSDMAHFFTKTFFSTMLSLLDKELTRLSLTARNSAIGVNTRCVEL